MEQWKYYLRRSAWTVYHGAGTAQPVPVPVPVCWHRYRSRGRFGTACSQCQPVTSSYRARQQAVGQFCTVYAFFTPHRLHDSAVGGTWSAHYIPSVLGVCKESSWGLPMFSSCVSGRCAANALVRRGFIKGQMPPQLATHLDVLNHSGDALLLET